VTDVLDRSDREVDDLDDGPVATLPLSLSAQTGRWRTAARLARREMRRRPWRTALSMLLIAVPVAAMVVADVAYRSDRLLPDLAMRFGAADARLYVGSDTNEQRAEVEAQFPDGTDWTWSPYAYVPLRSVADPDELVDATVVTRDMEDPLNAGTVRDLSGRYPNTPSEAVLDRELADDFGVGIGDELTFARPAQTFTVVGLADIGGDIGYPAVLAPGFDLTVLRPTVISYEVLVAHPSLAAEAAAMNGGTPNPPVEPFPQIEVRYDDPALGDNGVSAIGFELRGGYTPEPEPGVLFLGWLFGVLLMGVLGLVVAAAFAVSGRRQLVTIGQLSATGADPVLLRRFLALQGTWTGVAGAAVGVFGGLGIARAFAEPIRNDGRIDWSPTDWLIIAMTAVAVATVAAIVPTRSMAGMSVLSALGGRRPVRPVPRRQLPLGIALVTGGLAVIFLATVAARNANDTGGDFVVPGVAAALAGMAVIAGVCCLCPLLVDLIARAGAGRRGVPMLAARSLGRHRARAAALLAAIVAVGAVGAAAAAAGEQAIKDDRAIDADLVRWEPDVVLVRATTFDSSSGITAIVDSEAAAPGMRDDIEAIVGPVRWASASTVGTDPRMGDVYVADDALLELMGLTPTQRSNLAELDSFVLAPDTTADSWSSYLSLLGPSIRVPEPDQIVIPGLAFNYFTTFVSPAYLASAGLERQAPVLFGRADHDLSRSEADAVNALRSYDSEAQVFIGMGLPDSSVEVFTDCQCGIIDWTTWVRFGTLGGTLLLMTLIITLGMALWAAEGRDERDTLVAIGASPAVLARIAGTKAWALAFVGMSAAVPLGFGTLRLAVAAARQPATFPWVFVVVAIVGLPLVIGAGAWASSAIGQRARRVTASSAAVD
jgi:putative ABC transport system permease protein